MLPDIFFEVSVNFTGLYAGLFPLFAGDTLELGSLFPGRISDLAGFLAGVVPELLGFLGRRFLQQLGSLFRAGSRLFPSCFTQVIGGLLDGWGFFGVLLFIGHGFAHDSGWLRSGSGRQDWLKGLWKS